MLSKKSKFSANDSCGRAGKGTVVPFRNQLALAVAGAFMFAAAGSAFAADATYQQSQHDASGGHRHGSHRWAVAFVNRNDGHFRDRRDRGRALGNRPDQCDGRRSRQEDQRSSRKMAPPTGRHLRRKQRSCWKQTMWRQYSAAGHRLRARRYFPFWSAITDCCTTRHFMKDWSSPRMSSTRDRKPRSRCSPALTGLRKPKSAKTYYLIGSDYIWPRTTMKLARKYIETVLHGNGRRRRVCRAWKHRFRFDDQQDSPEKTRRDLCRRRGRFECVLVQAAQGGRHQPARTTPCSPCR